MGTIRDRSGLRGGRIRYDSLVLNCGGPLDEAPPPQNCRHRTQGCLRWAWLHPSLLARRPRPHKSNTFLAAGGVKILEGEGIATESELLKRHD